MNSKFSLLKVGGLLAVGLGLLVACGGGSSGGGGSMDNGGGGGGMNVPPVITSQPATTTALAGQTASFSGAANGSPAPTYQWERSGDGANWTAIAGATSASFSFASSKTDNAAQFRMKAMNVAGTATSTAATLNVQWAPTFTSEPNNQFVSSPSAAAFTAIADANPAPSYQWQSSPDGSSWNDVLGATSSSFNTGPTSTAMNDLRYRCVASNSVGSATSDAATLMVNVTGFALTVNLGTGASGTPAASSTYASGSGVNYSYTAQAGFTNLQVRLDGTAVAASGTVTMDAAHTLAVSATPVQAQNSVTFTAGAGGSISGNANQTVANGGSTTPVTAHPDSGFTFLNWTGSGFTTSTTNPLTLSNVTQNYAITANFSALPTFALSVSLGAGVAGTPSSGGEYLQGTAVNFSYSTQAGYTNLHVTLDGNPVAASGSVTMNAPHTLAATAVPGYIITASAGIWGSISPQGAVTVPSGGSQTFTITADTGFTIQSVVVDGVNIGAVPTYTFNNVLANHTISATFI